MNRPQFLKETPPPRLPVACCRKRNMHPRFIYPLVMSLWLVTISALPPTVPSTLEAEPQDISQHLLPAEQSYNCCTDEVGLSNPDSIPTDCKICTPEQPSSSPLSLPGEEGEIEGVFSFAGRAANGLANWKLSFRERKIEDMSGVERFRAELRKMQVLLEMAAGGGVGGDAGKGEAMIGK